MRVFRKYAALAAAVLGAGCVATAPQVREPDRLRTPFDAKEHAPFAATGTASIKGQAFLRQRGGGVVTCAGSAALLMPYTEYFLESTWYARERRHLTHEPDARAMLPAILRKTHCDAQGNFSFDRLPAGRYIVLTEVVWDVAGRRQGGVVMTLAGVSEGSTSSVIISDATPLR